MANSELLNYVMHTEQFKRLRTFGWCRAISKSLWVVEIEFDISKADNTKLNKIAVQVAELAEDVENKYDFLWTDVSNQGTFGILEIHP